MGAGFLYAYMIIPRDTAAANAVFTNSSTFSSDSALPCSVHVTRMPTITDVIIETK